MSGITEYLDILPQPEEANGFRKLRGGRASFLLGTDFHIGEPKTRERRVAITPDQAGVLKNWLADLGIGLDLMVVAGAGARAGYEDAAFQAEGARVLTESELPELQSAPQVVHALKEPTHYEATIPGPFLRIGALHSGDFKPGCGLAEVLKARAYRAIFDGSAVGGFAFLGNFRVKPKFRIPLRSSMSVYAGRLAGEDVGDRLQSHERVVVSGGGVVGTSAVNVLLERYSEKIQEILIIEKFPEKCELLRQQYRHDPRVRVKQGFEIGEDDIRDAMGLILTIFIQGSGATPKVIDIPRLMLMRDGGDIVDVAIDEGGGIRVSKDDLIDPSTGERPLVSVEDIRAEVESLPKRLTYHADNHMPRRRPREASVEHGKTALMYLAVLLYLCAAHDGPEGALRYILDQDYIEPPKTICDALVLDLKHGLAFLAEDRATVLYRQVLKKSEEIRKYLDDQGVDAVFA